MVLYYKISSCLIGLEDIVITKSLLFNPSTALMDVGPIEIRDDSLSEKRKEFNISIDRIEPVNYNIPDIRTTVQRDSIKIIAYDNDCKYCNQVIKLRFFNLMTLLFSDEVGFDTANSNTMLMKGASTNVCVKILALQPDDIDPTINIQLLISTSNISAGIVC